MAIIDYNNKKHVMILNINYGVYHSDAVTIRSNNLVV